MTTGGPARPAEHPAGGRKGAAAPLLVVLAGPQASGKSALASALGAELRRRGERVAVVELDAIAAMALPTLPGWDEAHAVFEAVVALWARTDLTCVVAEGSGTAPEVARLVRVAPPGTAVLTVAVTTDLPTAHARAQEDPTRGVSKDLAFLRGVYDRWPRERSAMAPDLVVDTTAADVADGVARVVDALAARPS
ncbi:zeta toxin family protein [Pseudokineococcus marinus]|uniref:Shikimate kinase n=1 Tax=Pseudokineococcus marinus TaxID=351215 RepID=A0A849BVF6_9ACTN|nr:zeta toxin family protein [Pseudokineococcus marinus]NNH24374.1 hypothetical protein [Pseudokineococcus marinus]